MRRGRFDAAIEWSAAIFFAACMGASLWLASAAVAAILMAAVGSLLVLIVLLRMTGPQLDLPNAALRPTPTVFQPHTEAPPVRSRTTPKSEERRAEPVADDPREAIAATLARLRQQAA